MAKTASASELRAKIEALQQQLVKAESSRQASVRKVVALMARLGVTLADIRDHERTSAAPAKATRRKAVAARRGNVSAPKYRHLDGREWTGRGRAPRWITDAEASGTQRDQFLIT